MWYEYHAVSHMDRIVNGLTDDCTDGEMWRDECSEENFPAYWWRKMWFILQSRTAKLDLKMRWRNGKPYNLPNMRPGRFWNWKWKFACFNCCFASISWKSWGFSFNFYNWQSLKEEGGCAYWGGCAYQAEYGMSMRRQYRAVRESLTKVKADASKFFSSQEGI